MDKDRHRKHSSNPTSTTSLGKRRSLKNKSAGKKGASSKQKKRPASEDESTTGNSNINSPRGSDYGSQASPLRLPANPRDITKVAILGAAGGIGQPLSLLLMLHSEYVQHLALYDLVHVRGVGADLSHVDRQCKITTHLGPDELADAVRDAKVIVIPAGLAQKPGMSRDDLFGSNAKIMFNLAKVCAQVAPSAHLAIISNPVNSLVPLTCEVYHQILVGGSQGAPVSQQSQKSLAAGQQSAHQSPPKKKEQDKPKQQEQKAEQQAPGNKQPAAFDDCFRRIFGVTTLDVVRASTLTARSNLFKPEANGLFTDPAKITMPVVGGHAGKTIMPLLSQASPKLDKKRLQEDKTTTQILIESIQQAGIEVLNAKKGSGSATLAMAYAACRFTISLLRAQQGEQNIVECAYVRQQHPIVGDLDYFATPLVLGKDGYVKSLGFGMGSGGSGVKIDKLLPFERQMVEDGVRELRSSVAKGEDFAREHSAREN